jgi:6-hydroxycyclohex-1-ene-1-carbonyl-CoA dehydrogenase
MHQPGRPMQLEELPPPTLESGEVLVRVAGCGVCHTDLGFFYEGVRTVHPVPLTLGHEISGIVEETGADARQWLGRAVVVPAVLPCGACDLCQKGRGTICRAQQMPGNHIDGGFASHVVVPAQHLCPVEVPDETTDFGDSGVTLRELSVVADAVTTPLQAIRESGLAGGEVAIFVGAGGIGGFGVQIAKALGATVVAIDIDQKRLELIGRYGADATFNSKEMKHKELRGAVREFVSGESLSPFEWKIFECSGTAAGQKTAYGLLTFGATLGVVGFTMESPELRLSNLMAFGARAIGNWGCDPQHYPAALALVERGRVRLEPFVQSSPLDEINSVFERLHRRELDRRPVLVPDFS